MNKTIWLSSTLLVSLGAAATLALPRQDEAEMMQKMMAYATPGEHHRVLDHKVGKWDLTVKMYMAPGQPPAESKATAEYEWILDGRYLVDHTEGDFGGMPFHGRGMTGYDNLKQKYVATWVDNMGTGIMTAEGTWDAAEKTFRFTAEAPDVMAGKIVQSRSEEILVDDDHWTMRMYMPGPDGEEHMNMEIDYVRVK